MRWSLLFIWVTGLCNNEFQMYNLGTGKGVSVMELITTFEQINNVKVPYQVEPRRAGDISEMYADPWVSIGSFFC